MPVTNYDSIADRFDRRYQIHAYAGVRDTLLGFLGSQSLSAVLEVGCGTGHWLQLVAAARQGPPDRLRQGDGGPPALHAKAEGGHDVPAPGRSVLAGVDPFAAMLARAHSAAPPAHLARARAEALPWRDGTFDRIFCINALHHFADRERFFEEARRVLRPGGGLLSVGKDPHAGRDQWWVYDCFPGTLDADRERFAPVRRLRGELTRAGFAWVESLEADHIEALMPAAEALATGVVDRAYTSQLTMLPEEDFQNGAARIRKAAAERAAEGAPLDLVTDFRLYATIGWM